MSVERLFQRIAEYTALDAPVGFEEPVLRRVRDELQQPAARLELEVAAELSFGAPGDQRREATMVSAFFFTSAWDCCNLATFVCTDDCINAFACRKAAMASS